MTQTYHSSAEQYSSGFSLALRMITVAAGVTIGLFLSQFIGLFPIISGCIWLIFRFQFIYLELARMLHISLSKDTGRYVQHNYGQLQYT